MAFEDLRQFIARLEEVGEITRVKVDVDPNFEMGAVSCKAMDLGGIEENKALFFERPLGYNIPVATNLLTSRKRYFIATETTPETFEEEWIRRTSTPIQPILVQEGPCKEVKFVGADVDLGRFPIPIWNEKDGGRYITFGSAISKDPETGCRNVGIYRIMVHDKQSLGIMVAPTRQISQFARKVHAKGYSLPVAIAIGLDPSITVNSCTSFPAGVDEFSMAGAIRGAPIKVVKCETIPLEVPANAEIVLEGEIMPGETKREGPFGEFTGYYGPVMEMPVIRLKAITHRSHPIYECTYEGRPPNCDSVVQIIPHEVALMRRVRMVGLKKIRLSVASAMFLAVASIEKKYAGQEKDVALAILGGPSGRIIKMLILVDEDVDPDNWADVKWALGTRLNPGKGVTIIHDLPMVALDPAISKQERVSRANRTTKLIIDATRPVHEPFAEECKPKADVMERVEANWAKYGV